MPSQNPVIALRLDQPMYDKLRELALADGRSMSNYVEHQLRRLLGPKLAPVFSPKDLADIDRQEKRAGRQMDITDAIAAAVKAGPVTTAAKQAAHRKNLAARAARMADRAAKHK